MLSISYHHIVRAVSYGASDSERLSIFSLILYIFRLDSQQALTNEEVSSFGYGYERIET